MGFLAVTPYLYYRDAAAALDWLTRVFGFDEEVRYLDESGTVAEAEMSVGDDRLMISGRAAGHDEGAGQLLIVHVDDVDAQHARVTGAGVAVAHPPADKPYGPRTFDVTDPWGYRWAFWQQVHDVELDEGWREIRPEAAATEPS